MSDQGLIQNPADLMEAAPAEPVRELPILAPKRDMFVGISSKPFDEGASKILMSPVEDTDVEIRPDGIIYLPEIKYRRRLNTAFRPGGWAVMPRGPFTMQGNTMTREYALYVDGRFVSQAVGEQEYIPNNGNMTYATASEGVRSNAIMRCCKDIGIASELWDPVFINEWKKKYAVQVWVQGKNRPMWRRKDRDPLYGETGVVKEKGAPVREQAAPLPEDANVSRPQETLSAPPDGSREPLVVPDAGDLVNEGGVESDQPPSDDLKKFYGMVAFVKESSGIGKDKRPYTKYSVKAVSDTEGERWFTTFSGTLGKVSKEVKGTKQTLIYSESQWNGRLQYDLESYER